MKAQITIELDPNCTIDDAMRLAKAACDELQAIVNDDAEEVESAFHSADRSQKVTWAVE